MEFCIVLALMVGVTFSIRAYIRYDPLLDLVKSGDKYILFLWYNKYDSWEDEYCTRKYIKLFEI